MVKTDSVTSLEIVQAFLDFLHSVEPSPGVDLEGLEVAKDCLTQVFHLDQLPASHRPKPNLLLNIFTTSRTPPPVPVPHIHATQDQTQHSSGLSQDELFGHFFAALDKIHFFRTTPTGDDDHVLLDRATSLFHDALTEIESSGTTLFDPKTLADALKILGNKAMQSMLYSDAIERYTCAIALHENNAVYYCNRAAAYTQIHKYNEAIVDCLKSIEIDPNYSKAYSRMGLAYYAQGKYSDAINKGFRKALELDPNNDSVKENIRVAEQKLLEEREQSNRYQNSGYDFGGGSRDEAASSGFGSIPANIASMFSNLAGNATQNQSRGAEDTQPRYVDGNAIPVEMANIVENIARTFRTGHDTESSSFEQTNPSSASVSFEAGTIPIDIAGMFRNMSGGQASEGQNGDPSIGSGTANFSFNIGGGQTPEDLNQAFSSMMGMFSGTGTGTGTDTGASQEDPHNGRPNSR